MTPADFITKWRASELKERSAAQEHFIDLCRLLGEPTPVEADPAGDHYCFERGAYKDSGGGGWADVWKHHCFAWEYKGKHANLDAAFDQLRQYALALGTAEKAVSEWREVAARLGGSRREIERMESAFRARGSRASSPLGCSVSAGAFLSPHLHEEAEAEERPSVDP